MRGNEVLGWLGSGLLLLLLSCGGDDPNSAAAPAAGFPSGGGGLSAAGPAPVAAPLLAATPPAGVDAKLWQALNAALAREIARQHPDSIPVAATSAAGAAAFNRRLKPPPLGAGVWDAVPASEWRTVPSADARSASRRRTSAPPTGTGAVVGDLALTANADGSAQFGWSYRCPGDYDQNGEVNLADLTPVGVGYGKSSSASDWARYEPADGDGNGEINLADVTPIGASFGATFEGYELQHTATPANEPSWQATGAEAPLSSATAPPGGGRKSFSLTIPAGDPSLVDNEYFRVRGYSGSGAGRQYGAPSISVQYHPGAPPVENQPPIAVLAVEPQSGLAPLDVLLDATSSGDIDGEILKYEFDADGPLNGEAWTDMGPAGIMPFSYLGSGDFLCALRVTDDGGATDTDLALVKSRDPNPPSAALTAGTLSGPTPLHVVWDASGSADTDGLVVDYEWDFDNDGEYEYDSGPVPTADFYYYEPGDFPVKVRVTDNDGLSNSATSQASASLGASWHVQTVPYEPQSGNSAELLEVEGRPGVFANLNGTEGLGLYYLQGDDPEASAWADPVLVASELYATGAEGLGVALVGGNPAVVGEQYYVRAHDSLGQSWADPILLPLIPPGGSNAYAHDLLLVQGKPLLLGNNLCGVVQASDPLGSAFEPPVTVYGIGYGGNLALVSGKPALVTMGEQSGPHPDIKYCWARDGEGAEWSPMKRVAQTPCYDATLMLAGGSPAVAFVDESIKALSFTRAADPLGDHWLESRVLYQPACGVLDYFFLDGRPALVYQDYGTKDIMFIAANDEEGLYWSLPQRVSDETVYLTNGAAAIGSAIVDGRPSASYCLTEASIQKLSFAQYR